MENVATWFEIPSADFDRAVRFYEAMFALSLDRQPFPGGGGQMALFPYAEGKVGGSVVQCDMVKPGADGVLIYLNGGDDLAIPLGRVEAAGGQVVVPKTQISPEIGWFAMFKDTEGNVLGLHSMQ